MFELTIPFWHWNGLMTGKLVYEICPDLEFGGGGGACNIHNMPPRGKLQTVKLPKVAHIVFSPKNLFTVWLIAYTLWNLQYIQTVCVPHGF